MIIQMCLRRTVAQQCCATLTTWTVRGGVRELAQVVWDPSGPLDSRTAAMQALRALLEALDEPICAQTQTV